MYSLSKTTVSPDALHAIADEHFGGRGGLASFEELKDGYFNAAYRLELGDGTRCVVKVAPPDSVRVLRYERGIMRAEVEVMQLVHEQTDLPVPQVLCYDDSRSIVDSDFFAMAYLPGRPFTQSQHPVLIGTWAAATWAIRFYEKHGFRVVSHEEKERLLRIYWDIPERQVETSVVLA